MNEQWVDISHVYGLRDVVQVSNLGNVRHKRRNSSSDFTPFHSSIKSDGYRHIGIYLNSGKRSFFSIHKLVAIAFIEKPDGRNYVNHRDGNPKNNSADNLEWVTAKENSIHSAKINRFKRMRDLSDYDITNIAIDIRMFGKSSVFDKYKISFSTIRNIARRHRNRNIISQGKQLSIF